MANEVKESVNGLVINNTGFELNSEILANQLGLKLNTDKVTVEEQKKQLRQEAEKPTYYVTQGEVVGMMKEGLIPSSYKESWFEAAKVKENISNMRKEAYKTGRPDFTVAGFNRYTETLSTLISTISLGLRPDRSWLIGAPPNFGKTSFVMTCLKLMHVQGMKAVPYISLYELAELNRQNTENILNSLIVKEEYKYPKSDGKMYLKDGIGNKPEVAEEEIEKHVEYIFKCRIGVEKREINFVKRPIECITQYSWSEYMNSDILFCFFTEIMNKVVESSILKCILNIRSAKGLPTVVLIDTSVDAYTSDAKLREYVWDEIMEYGDKSSSFDRLTHISTYKKYSSYIE